MRYEILRINWNSEEELNKLLAMRVRNKGRVVSMSAVRDTILCLVEYPD